MLAAPVGEGSVYEVVIVEDSEAEAKVLLDHIAQYDAERKIGLHVTRFTSAEEFLEKRDHCDLIFMDIDLPEMNGMAAARRLRADDPHTPIIFATNLAQYAIRGYEVDALDFIVKPISYYSFVMRMDRAVRAMRRNGSSNLTVTASNGISIVPIESIVYVEIKGHYLNHHLVGGEVLTERGSISKMEETLAPHAFVRISQGHLVNMAHITRMGPEELVVAGGETLYFSRPRRGKARETITKYLTGVL